MGVEGIYDIGSIWALLLTITAFFTAFLTAVAGLGGGVLLFAVMAVVMPVTALVPVHGLVQFAANANRGWLTRQQVNWSLVRFFSVGALIGAGIASQVAIRLPLPVMQLIIGCFILYLIWGKPYKAEKLPLPFHVLTGAVTTFMSMLVGATGPLVAGFINNHSKDKLVITANFSTCMALQHGLKGLLFSLVGFEFLPWLGLIAAMVIAGSAGTWVGLKMLGKLKSQHFILLFRWVATLLAIKLLWEPLSNWLLGFTAP